MKNRYGWTFRIREIAAFSEVKLIRKALKPIVASTLVVPLAVAAGNGSNPKGKPFVAINDQIVEVQGAVSTLRDQIDLLVGRVDTVEGRITATENAIQTLQNANVSLAALISANATDIALIQAAISDLQDETLILQQNLATLSGDTAVLEQQIADNNALIANLQSALVGVENGLISLDADLQSQIDNNVVLISALQEEIDDLQEALALKQDVLDGQCPNGAALQSVGPDGSIFCTSVSGGSIQAGSTLSLVKILGIGGSFQQFVFCPTGWQRTGPGFFVSIGISTYRAMPSELLGGPSNGFALRFRNDDRGSSGTVQAIAHCMRFNP